MLWPFALGEVSSLKKMVALDLDGTLLNREHRVTEVSKKKLAELVELGTMIVVASGRSGPAMYGIVEYLGLESDKMFAVAYNGACAYEFPRGYREGDATKILFEKCVDDGTVEAVLRFAETRGLLVQVYEGNEIIVHCKTDEHRDFTKRYSALTGCRHTHVDAYGTRSQVLKMLVMTDDPDRVVDELRRSPIPGAHVIRGSPPFFVEILHEDVCKGNGLRRLCRQVGLDLTDVIAFGDGDNDLEFLQVAGLGVAMRNGRDLVKNAADRITDFDHHDDGVARYLQLLQDEGFLPSSSSSSSSSSEEDDDTSQNIV